MHKHNRQSEVLRKLLLSLLKFRFLLVLSSIVVVGLAGIVIIVNGAIGITTASVVGAAVATGSRSPIAFWLNKCDNGCNSWYIVV